MKHRTTDTTLEIGSDHVTLRRRGRSAPIIAQILHCERAEDGSAIYIVCDRRIHKAGERSLGGFRAWGAVTTELERVRDP